MIFDGYTGSGSVFEAEFLSNSNGTDLSVIGTETRYHALALERVLACKPNNVDLSTDLSDLPNRPPDS
ncbi:hypothetical protein DDD63_08785 [Actinobaculum sp. 313]|nr:hypothetical protein DDD63_08785 [Actinobaculum sp. 313]